MHLILMRAILKSFSVVLLCLAGLSTQAAHTQASLILAAESAKPGDTVLAGVRLRIDHGWHTYWRNPGASGMPTKIEWQLPTGVSADATEWPAPQKLPEEDLTTYVYTDDVVLLVPLKLVPDLKPGMLELKATVSWLECKTLCVPGKADIEAGLTIAVETKPSKDAPLLESWLKKLPQKGNTISPHAWWEKPANSNLRPLLIEWTAPKEATLADFFPDGYDHFEVQPNAQRVPASAGKICLRVEVNKFEGDWPKEISGLLIQNPSGQQLAYEASLSIQPFGPASTASCSSETPTGPVLATPSLWIMLLYAFIGGLILNVMPCVLPVIALKILGFVGQAKDEPRRVRQLGLIYTLGVLLSFLILAALVIGVKAAGHRASWGMPFGNPQFLVVLVVVVTLVALNLFGLFEVNLGANVMDAAGSLASRHGAAGAFFNGVLATVLATPCTAPFLGIALGFAFTQVSGMIVLMFMVMGLGLAAPYLLLSWYPACLKFLPKPGAWTERFKVAMGFPMLATAIWLFSLITIYYGSRSWWLGIFLAAWVYGQFVQRSRTYRRLGLITALVVLVVGYFYALEDQLDWRLPGVETKAEGLHQSLPDGIAWQRWNPDAVASARAQGRPVFVDFTADWCLTCQVNKRIAIDIPSVRARLKTIDAVSLLGDYTRLPDDITTELNRYGRAGVPLVLVFPKDPEKPPIVLPELLTSRIVLAALEQAGR